MYRLAYFLLFVFAIMTIPFNHDGQPLSTASAEGTTPVVVELFTSEGCSSCPPADALLADLEAKQPVAGVQILALEEHVDYWDQLGWKDPFSGHEWTLRQQEYARNLGSGNVYTPQMVINGRSELVGSRSDQVRRLIQQQRESQPRVEVYLAARIADNNDQAQVQLVVKNHASPTRDPADIWLAVTESGLHSAVLGGENSGEDLHHASVVRSLRKIDTVPQGNQSADASPFSNTSKVSLSPNWNRPTSGWWFSSSPETVARFSEQPPSA